MRASGIFVLSLFVVLTIGAEENWAPGEVIVGLELGVIRFPAGVREVNTDDVTISEPEVQLVFESLSIQRIRKIFKDAQPGVTQVYSPHFEKMVEVPDLSQIYKLSFPTTMDVQNVVDQLEALPGVKYAHPNLRIQPDVFPNDPYFPQQWHLHNEDDCDIDAPEAWDITKGAGIDIAIIDEGVDQDHEDLWWKCWFGEEGFQGAHGTRVAGVAAAETDNWTGVAGVGWESLIIPRRDDGTLAGAMEDIYDVSWYAEVINMSWSVQSEDPLPDFEDCIWYAHGMGCVLIAASGNTGTEQYDFYPQVYEQVLSVGGSTRDDRWWDGADYGTWLDVVAPAVGIWTTDTTHLVGESYGAYTGTSFACPQASGLAALLNEYACGSNPGCIYLRITAYTDEVEGPGWHPHTGWGRINCFKALVPGYEGYFIRGDANSDSSVGMGDALYILNHLYVPGAPSPTCIKSGDANDDGSVALVDALYVLNYNYVPGSPPPPAPFPDCGADPTADTLSCNDHPCMSKASVREPEAARFGGMFSLGDVRIAEDEMTVPVYLNNSEPVSALSYTIRYDPSTLIFKGMTSEGLATEWFDFFSGRTDEKTGSVAVGGVVDFTLSKTLVPGSHQVSEMVFDTKGYIKDLVIRLIDVQLFDKDGQLLSAETCSNPPRVPVSGVLSLSQNAPNPVRGWSMIRYQLPVSAPTTLKIYNPTGQLVRILVDEVKGPGRYAAEWDGKDQSGGKVSPGVYFYQLSTGELRETRKLVVVE